MIFDVGVLVGGLSSGSINQQLAKALMRLAPAADLRMQQISIRELPLYSQDFDSEFPPVARSLKESIGAVDAIAIVTPEYNRSIPGSLKNALDWASRPWGANSFEGKPSAVIGTSPGSMGTAVGQQHLRSILSFLASPELAQPEAYIQFKDGLITAQGDIEDERLASLLNGWLSAFHTHIAKNLTAVT